MRKQKRVDVFNKEKYDGAWPPLGATEFVAWFARKLGEIPSEYWASANIEIDSRSVCEGSSYASIEIYYVRPETDEEMAFRESEELFIKEAQKKRELRTLADLKAKYES